MKKIIFLIVSVLCCIYAVSQEYTYLPYINKTSVWSENRLGCNSVYVKYFYGKDTLINDTVWTELKKTYLSDNDGYSCSNNGTYLNSYLTEDLVNRKVWQKKNGITVLFRDFDGSVGDTVFGKDSLWDWGPQFYEIITMDTIIEMNGLKIRKLNDSYYEGLGYLGTFARHYILLECVDCEKVNMVCYERDGKIIYQNPAYTSCWPESVGIAQVGNEETSLVASPLRGTSLVRTAGYDLLRLVSASGSELLRITLQGADMYSLDVSSVPAGNYILVLSRTDGSSVRQTVQMVN